MVCECKVIVKALYHALTHAVLHNDTECYCHHALGVCDIKLCMFDVARAMHVLETGSTHQELMCLTMVNAAMHYTLDSRTNAQ